MSVDIRFDEELAVANIQVSNWAPPLVDYLRRYFAITHEVLQLNYDHLSDAITSKARFDVDKSPLPERARFVRDLNLAAIAGPMEVVLSILRHGYIEIRNSPSIADGVTVKSALSDFWEGVFQGTNQQLRRFFLAEISPSAHWVIQVLHRHSSQREQLLNDQEIMTELVKKTSASECIHVLKLVDPSHGGAAWAFERLVETNLSTVLDYIEINVSKEQRYADYEEMAIVYSLFANSQTIQASRLACEHVLRLAHPNAFTRLIEHCRTLVPDDVRGLFHRWYAQAKTSEHDDFKDCVVKAYSTLEMLIPDTMPCELALSAAWHEFGSQIQPVQQIVFNRLAELPTGPYDCEAEWIELGPAAREAWRQELLDQVRGEPELAQGLFAFTCLWLDRMAFAEVEPVLLRLMDGEDHLAFVNRLACSSTRRVQLRAMGLVRLKLGTLNLEGAAGHGEEAAALPSVGAQTWLGDPSVERVIHWALSVIEERFCREYAEHWGEDEETHTARLLALTEEGAKNATHQLRQLSVTTRAKYPSLSVKVRQPSKREEGSITASGAPLGADVLFLTKIVDQGKTVIQKATLIQVKKRRGIDSGKGFSSTIGVDLQQCEDMLTQTEHAFYLIATPPAPRPSLWVAPARLVRNLTQLHTSKSSVVALQVRDASSSYADFFLNHLIGLWAGDEDENIVAIANGDPLRGRTPRHIVDIEVSRQSD